MGHRKTEDISTASCVLDVDCACVNCTTLKVKSHVMARFVSTNNNDRGLVLGIYLALSTAICRGKVSVFGGQWGQNKGNDRRG